MSFNVQGSASLYERAYRATPSGVHSSTRARAPHPIYFSKGKGGEVWDVDGNRYMDLIMGNGAIMLGHGNEAVQQSIREALDIGLSTGIEWEMAVEVAEQFLELVPHMDLVRFANTGTEAVIHALHVARHHTGKTRLAKMEGSYHGWTDELFISCWPDMSKNGSADAPVSLAGSMGLHPAMVESTLVLPFNDVERTQRLIEQHADDLAAVILEPVMIDIGYIKPTADYLHMLRGLCTTHNIVLIFDELLTGFRTAPGGAQQTYGISADLATYGKAIANGYPMAALAGKESFMRLTEPGNGPVFVGTFNANVIPLAAAKATLPQLKEGTAQETLNQRTQKLRSVFDEEANSLGIPAQLVGEGGHLHWYFSNQKIMDYRSATTSNAQAYAAFNQVLAKHGVLVMANPLSHHAICLGHDDALIMELEHIFREGLKAAASTILTKDVQ